MLSGCIHDNPASGFETCCVVVFRTVLVVALRHVEWFVFRTILAVPIVDGINWDNMAYYSVYDSRHHRGIFEWGFLYKESVVPEKELATREHASEPYR